MLNSAPAKEGLEKISGEKQGRLEEGMMTQLLLPFSAEGS